MGPAPTLGPWAWGLSWVHRSLSARLWPCFPGGGRGQLDCRTEPGQYQYRLPQALPPLT